MESISMENKDNVSLMEKCWFTPINQFHINRYNPNNCYIDCKMIFICDESTERLSE